MRYVAMQVLTWGTIAGAIGSALLIAALESPVLRHSANGALDELRSSAAAQAGRARPESPANDADAAGSAPRMANR